MYLRSGEYPTYRGSALELPPRTTIRPRLFQVDFFIRREYFFKIPSPLMIFSPSEGTERNFLKDFLRWVGKNYWFLGVNKWIFGVKVSKRMKNLRYDVQFSFPPLPLDHYKRFVYLMLNFTKCPIYVVSYFLTIPKPVVVIYQTYISWYYWWYTRPIFLDTTGEW